MRETSKNLCMREGDNISLQNAGVSAKSGRLDRSVTGLVNSSTNGSLMGKLNISAISLSWNKVTPLSIKFTVSLWFISSEKSAFTACQNFFRSSRPEVLNKKGVARNFTKFTGKHLCQSIFFNKKRLGTGVFLWILRNFYKHKRSVLIDRRSFHSLVNVWINLNWKQVCPMVLDIPFN